MTNHRNIWTELLDQKSEVLARIAASGQDNARLRILTAWLGRELDLEAKHKGLLSEAEQLIAERLSPNADHSRMQPVAGTIKAVAPETWTLADLGKSERARVARCAFFGRETEKGKTYAQVGRIYFRNDDGVVLGITFSSDKGDGTWFLNLQAGQFQDAVLLCQTGPRSAQAIYLPKRFLDRYSGQMSKDHKGEIKFNVRRAGDKFFLDVPQPVGPVDVTCHLHGDELTCHRVAFL